MTKRWYVFGLIAGLFLALVDARAKIWAIHHAPAIESIRLTPLFDLALHKNPGIAFDIPVPLAVIAPLTIIICVAFAYLSIKLFDHNRPASLAAVIIVIGALGNLLDRILNGFTTDYLIFFRTSALNISDLLIIAGMTAFLVYYKHIPR